VHPECTHVSLDYCKAFTFAHPVIIDLNQFGVNHLLIMTVCTFVCT